MKRSFFSFLLSVTLIIAGCAALQGGAPEPTTEPSPSPTLISLPSPTLTSPLAPPPTPTPAPGGSLSVEDGHISLATQDGLSLTLSSEGRVESLQVDGAELVSAPAPVLFVRDMTPRLSLRPETSPSSVEALRPRGSAKSPRQSYANLLSNPGFELDDDGDGVAEGWKVFVARDARVSLSQEVAQGGDSSLYIESGTKGLGAYISEPVVVTAGRKYRIAGHFKSREGYVSHLDGPPTLWQRALYLGKYRTTGLYLQWYGTDGQALGGPTLAMALHWNAHQWKRLTREVEAPAEAVKVAVIVAAVVEGEGVWIDDISFIESPEVEEPIMGEVSVGEGAVVQRAELPAQHLIATTTYTPYADHLEIRSEIEETSGSDRALEVAFGLPVDATGWRWWDDIRDNRSIEGQAIFENVVSADFNAYMPMSLYPYAAIEDGELGLALAVPLDEPRVARLAYDNQVHRYEVRFYLGFSETSASSPLTTKLGSRASFTLLLYRFDPVWGFRAAVKKYADMHPDWFESSLDASRYASFEQGNFMGHNAPLAKEHDEQGIYSAQYIASELPLKMGPAEGPAPTYEETMGALEEALTSPRRPVRERALAYERSVAYDTNGDWMLKHIGVYKWAPDRWEVSWVADLDPDIEGGYGQYLIQGVIDLAFADTQAMGATLDGVQIDNFMSTPTVDVRPEHLALADLPLTYSFNTYQPGVHTMAGMYEYLAYLRRHLDESYGPGKGVSINFWGLGTVNFLAPFIDGFGGEGKTTGNRQNWNEEILDYRRTVAYHRLMLFANQEPGLTLRDLEEFAQLALFYGIIPRPGPHGSGWQEGWEEVLGRYTALVRVFNAEGWEPVTYARSDNPDVLVERFGAAHFTVHNRLSESTSYILRISATDLGFSDPAELTLTELVSGADVVFEVEGGEIIISDEIDGKATKVFRAK
ncbi:MAG: hypothetical protein ACE5NP_00645 [Anaerolineae bacterium]